MKFRTWAALIAIVVLSLEGALLATNARNHSCPHGERIRMPMPFNFAGGYSYVTEMPPTGDRSHLVICENDRLLGPAHSTHQEVRERGRGRFLHWYTDLLFSTSDNSDPNTNRRSYQAIRVDRR